MPHVIVKMHPGRSEQQKAQLTEAIVKDVMTFTGSEMKPFQYLLRKSGRATGWRRSTSPIF
jgi:hypothetical protein